MSCPNFSTYSSGCRCDVCTRRAAVHRQQVRNRTYLRSQGHTFPSDKVDPTPAVEAVTRGYADGLSFAQMGEMSNVSDNTIRELYIGARKWITRVNCDAIVKALEDRRVVMFKGSYVPTRDYTWKVRGLYAQGWSYAELVDMLHDGGYSTGFLRSFHQRKNLLFKNAQAIDWLVKQIGDRKGSSLNNVGKMAFKGVFPLIHYTEEGRLLVSSLTPEQRRKLDEHRARKRKRVQSKHGANSGGGTGS